MKQFGVFGTPLLSLVKHYKKTLPNSESKNPKRLQFILMFSALILYAWSRKILVIPYSIFRSTEEQNIKYQQGRTLPGRVITSIDGKYKISKHQKWRAGDILILDDEFKSDWKTFVKYETLGLFWEKMGGTWGHRWYEKGLTKFDDLGHFEI